MAPAKTSLSARIGLTLLSGSMLALCFEPVGLKTLVWVALAPFLVALAEAKPTTTRALGFLLGCVFYGATLHWLFRIFGMAAVSLIAILGATVWAFGVVYSLAETRFGTRFAMLLAPVLWVGVDLFRSELWFFEFSWMQLGFSQVRAPVVLQSVGTIGVYGLTLLIVLVNCLVARVVAKHGWGRGIAAAGLVLVGVALPSCIGLIPTDPREAGVRVGAIQSEASDLDLNLELTAACAESGPKLIVWPEYSLMEYPFDDEATLAKIADAAREAEAYLVVGCKEHIPGETAEKRYWNAAALIGPDGKLVGSYHKNHPVQFFSDGVSGGEYPTFETDIGRLGIAICYDMDFAPVFRRLVNNGAEILLVPTYDAIWWGKLQHDQHSAMARARAVEVGRWVVRATSSGTSQIIDDSGSTLRALGWRETGHVSGGVLPIRKRTLYCRGGWVLPYVCLGLTVLFIAGEIARMLASCWRRRAMRSDGE